MDYKPKHVHKIKFRNVPLGRFDWDKMQNLKFNVLQNRAGRK